MRDLKDELAKSFQERWTKVHKCDRPGCESCLIIDGDLKPHRMLCAAKLCGIREFANSDVKVVTALWQSFNGRCDIQNFELCLSFYSRPNNPDTISGDEMNSSRSKA